MKLFLAALVLALLPFSAIAEESRNCSLGLGAGHITIDQNRFTMSSAERRLMQDTRVNASRNVHNKTSAQQLSFGCMVTDHWGVDLVATRGIEFNIDNTIAIPDLAAFERINDLPVVPTSATVTRKVRAQTAFGLVVNYTLPITDAIDLRLGVGVHHLTLNETSQVSVSDTAGKQFIIPGPSEKKSGNVPTITIGVGMNVARHTNLVGQVYAPEKGVRAVFINLKYDL